MKKIFLFLIFLFQLNIASAGDVQPVDTQQLIGEIKKTPGEKVLFFFVSWCQPCIETIKSIAAENIIFISLDESKSFLEKFAKKIKYNVFHLQPSENNKNILELSKALSVDVARPSSEGGVSMSYHHIAFLDSNNKVLRDNIEKEDLDKYLK